MKKGTITFGDTFAKSGGILQKSIKGCQSFEQPFIIYKNHILKGTECSNTPDGHTSLLIVPSLIP